MKIYERSKRTWAWLVWEKRTVIRYDNTWRELPNRNDGKLVPSLTSNYDNDMNMLCPKQLCFHNLRIVQNLNVAIRTGHGIYKFWNAFKICVRSHHLTPINNVPLPLGKGDIPLADWLTYMTFNQGIWGSKPTRALCALPQSGAVGMTHVALQVGPLVPLSVAAWFCEKRVKDLPVEGFVAVLHLIIFSGHLAQEHG